MDSRYLSQVVDGQARIALERNMVEGEQLPEYPLGIEVRFSWVNHMWLQTMAASYSTLEEEIITSSIRFGRYLIESKEQENTSSFVDSLMDRSVQGIALKSKIRGMNERTSMMAQELLTAIGRLELLNPKLEIEVEGAEAEAEAIDEDTEEEAIESAKDYLGKFEGVYELEPELIVWVLKQAEEFQEWPSQIINGCLRLSRFVFSNTGGQNSDDFNYELFCRQCEVDKRVLQLLRILDSLETTLPRLDIARAQIIDNLETIILRSNPKVYEGLFHTEYNLEEEKI